MSNSPSKPGGKYWGALEPYWKAVSIYDGGDVFSQQFQQLPPGVGILFAAHWLDSEVRNGGFHQFFTNPTGVLAPEALAAYRTLKLDDVAVVIEQAVSFFGLPYPRERDVRLAMLKDIPGKTRAEWDPFFKLDDKYYELLPSRTHRFALAADAYAENNVV